LTILPEGLGNFTSLTEIHLGGCSSLRTLIEGLGNFISLTKIDLGECASVSPIWCPHAFLIL
jgi:hypothetical protein